MNMADVEITAFPPGALTPEILDPDHYEAFCRAFRHLLDKEIVLDTIAQLFDGIPLSSVVRCAAGIRNFRGSPVSLHTNLCEGAFDKAKEFISSFDPACLKFEASLLQAFQNATPDSTPFQHRLLEMVARGVHSIATSLDFRTDKLHQGNIAEAIAYQHPPRVFYIGKSRMVDEPVKALPHLFFNIHYRAYEQYPFGIADMAGYWAEDRIFGGVVLFDRGESGKEANSVWFHSGHRFWTTRIWKPMDWQMDAMMELFATGSTEHATRAGLELHENLPDKTKRYMDHKFKDSQFPFFCDINNRTRHDDWDAMKYHHIYRDPWERKLPEEKFIGCTRNSFDYPELEAWAESIINHPGPSYDITPTSFDESPYGVKVKESDDAADQNSVHKEEYIPLP